MMVGKSNNSASPAALPPRILGAYTGQFAPDATPDDERYVSIDSIIRNFLDPMAAANFNTFYFKVSSWHGFKAQKENRRGRFDLSAPAQRQRLQQMVEACVERNLTALVYIYPEPHTGKRHPELDKHLPPFVRADGTAVEDLFSLIHYPTWQQLFYGAFEVARASLEMPITGVLLDLETVHHSGISYDDKAWSKFAGEHELAPDTPAGSRVQVLEERDLRETYERFFRTSLEKVAQQFQQEMHAINPNLILGTMEAGGGWFYGAFIKHLATERVPAIMDHWGMYNGEGLTDSVLQEQKRIKAANPHNLFVPWFRPDSYHPSCIKVHAYHAAMKTDGYSNWHIGMLTEDTTVLPVGYNPGDYFNAFGIANEKVLADLAAGRPAVSIPFRPAQPLVAKLDLKAAAALKIPSLKPVGDGLGEPSWIPTRELQIFFTFAEAGEPIRMDVKHLAGAARPRSLQYALICPAGKILRNEAVRPGGEHNFSVTAPVTGTYALFVTGGAGGQAWYGIRIHNHMAFPGSRKNKARFFHHGPFMPLNLWLTRSDLEAPAYVYIQAARFQKIAAQVDDGKIVTADVQPVQIELPPGRETHRLRLWKPEQLPEGYYTQAAFVWVEGAVKPYLSDGPQRRLIPGN